MFDIDLKLMDLCNKHYWFVYKNYKGFWVVNIFLLDAIEVNVDEILYITASNDEEVGPVFSSRETFIAESLKEANKLLDELSRGK
jgi:hypothetical protein